MKLAERYFLRWIYNADAYGNIYTTFYPAEGFEKEFCDSICVLCLGDTTSLKEMDCFYKITESSTETPYKILMEDGEINVTLQMDTEYTKQHKEDIKSIAAEIDHLQSIVRYNDVFIMGNDEAEIRSLFNKIDEWFWAMHDSGIRSGLRRFAEFAGLDNPQSYHCNGDLSCEIEDMCVVPYPAIPIATETNPEYPMIRMWRDIAKKYAPNSKVIFLTQRSDQDFAESNDMDSIYFKDEEVEARIVRGEFPDMN